MRPKASADKCIQCGKCEKTCPICNPIERLDIPIGVFAAKIRDADAHKHSQSGGVFYALAEEILRKGGCVYGAALNRQFKTEHIRVSDLRGLRELQSVKYVQSDIGNTYSLARKDLQKGIPVLFSGTPCQIAGLRNFLKSRETTTENLLTVDLVCYGVPSPGVFRAWVDCIEKAHKGKLISMQYRRTDALWGKGKEWYSLDNGQVLEGDYFTKLYFRNLIIRPSCESCRFCHAYRPGDVTLGDFWGINNTIPDFYDDRGVSLVMLNSEKGKTVFNQIQDRIIWKESDLPSAVAAQPRLQGIAVKPSIHRSAFWKKYYEKGMEYIAMEEGFILPSVRFRLTKKMEALKNRWRNSK